MEREKDDAAGALWMSDLERRIVAALVGRSWTPARELCRLLGESETGDFRAVARNLVERRILESAPSRGYRIAPTYQADRNA